MYGTAKKNKFFGATKGDKIAMEEQKRVILRNKAAPGRPGYVMAGGNAGQSMYTEQKNQIGFGGG